jgi:hypothetical protein
VNVTIPYPFSIDAVPSRLHDFVCGKLDRKCAPAGIDQTLLRPETPGSQSCGKTRSTCTSDEAAPAHGIVELQD